MTIDKNFLGELRLRLPLSAIIGQRIKITRAGREYKACCPFHEEKSPSFYVNDDKGFFHCFGCGAHGDIVGFRMRYDNVSFREAVEGLARDAGLKVPDSTPADHARYDHNRALQKVMELATLWFESQLRLPANRFALDYLAARGLTDETIRAFRIGYAPNNWDALRDALLQQDVKLDQLVETGLLKLRENDDRPPYAFFRGRIMFPVGDRQGLTIAFGGRHLDAAFSPSEFTSSNSFKPAKYINSFEYSLFNKGSQLFSLSRARASLKDAPLLIVEGFVDVIALHQAGFRTAVAPLGTALTETQIQLAWQAMGSDGLPPILCFDGDKAGVTAAYRALERMLPFLTPDRQARFAFLPEGEDPDSLVKTRGAPAFQAILDQARSVFDVLWARGVTTHGTAGPEAQAKLQAEIDAAIQQIADKNLAYVYGQELRNRLYQLRRPAFTPGAPRLNSYRRDAQGRPVPPPPPVALTSPRGVARDSLQTRFLFAAILNHPWLLHTHDAEFAQLTPPEGENETSWHELQQTLLHLPPELLRGEDVQPRQNLLEYLSDQGFDPIVKTLLTDQVYKHAGFARPGAERDSVLEGWHTIWAALQKDRVKLDVTEITKRAKHSPADMERLWELKRQQLQGENDDL